MQCGKGPVDTLLFCVLSTGNGQLSTLSVENFIFINQFQLQPLFALKYPVSAQLFSS